MSGIFGFFNRDESSASADVLQGMLDAVSYWGPDATGLWRERAVGLGHAMLRNTPESKLEQLPEQTGGLVISMDARLDNREELAPQLDLAERPLSEIKESEFILAAYRKWGEACPEYLVGDFAFVIWDEQKQQLFCARDHVGVKPFYYFCDDDCFVFGNDLKALLAHPSVSGDINDEAVANYLVNYQLNSDTLTFFQGAQQLPPAHSLTLTAGRKCEQCYWRLEDAPKLELADMATYAQQLRELLERAVVDRMRSAYPISSHLSGGLDSSSIAVIAARKLREKGEKLLAFNWLHAPEGEDDPDHYEWANSRKIAEAEGIDHHYVPLDADDIYRYMKARSIFYGDTSTFWYEYPVRAAAQEWGSRTILSGWGGDELATYHGQAYFSDLFLQGKFTTVFKGLWQRAEKNGKHRTRRLLGLTYHQLIMLLVPKPWYRFMPKNRAMKNEGATFVSQSFLPMVEAEMKKPAPLTMQPQRTIRKHMLAYWQNGHIQARIASWATTGTPNKLEYSYPLLDKRILEFVLGLPAECFVRRGKGRYVFRKAAEGLLEEELLWGDKEAEPERVTRLVELMLAAWKKRVVRGKALDEKNKYIIRDEVVQAIERIDGDVKDVDTSICVRRIDIILALRLSQQIRIPNTSQN